MLPDIRFLVGAVLASAVLIVSAFGLAATVRVAQHARLAPLDVSRPLAYAEPIEHIYGADRRFDGRDTDPLLERLAAIPTGNTDTNGAGGAPKPPVEIVAPLQVVPAVAAETIAAPEAKQMASPEVAPAAPELVAALPAPTDEAAPVEVSAKSAVAPHPTAPKAKAAAKQKRVAKARRVRSRIVVRQPTASTGYPVSGSGSSTFDNQFFRKDRKAQ